MIVFRCDADEKIGYGHFFRCLSIAATAKRLGENVAIRTQNATITMEQYCEAYEVELQQGQTSIEELRELNTDWVFVDGYHIPLTYVVEIASEFQVAVIDDLAQHPITADLLINPNYGSANLKYNMGSATVCLTGPEFAPLRPEFSEVSTSDSTSRRVFVCLGGGDNSALLSQVLSALPADWTVVVVPGASSLPGELSPNLAIHRSPPNMAEIMRTCDSAIVGAGSTVWECLALGMKVGAIKVAENQDIVARELSSAGYIQWLNPDGKFQLDWVRRFFDWKPTQAPPSEWSDGLGAVRILDKVEELRASTTIRRARQVDVRGVWEINNETLARRNAVQQAPIPYETHVEWFERSLESPTRLLWVLPNQEDKAIGVVRADLTGSDARISIALAPSTRGSGFGKRILTDAIGRLKRRADIRTVSAIIRPENLASVAIFERLEFHYLRDETIEGERFLYYVLSW